MLVGSSIFLKSYMNPCNLKEKANTYMNVEYKFGNNLKVSKVQEFPETLALYELEANQFIVDCSD